MVFGGEIFMLLWLQLHENIRIYKTLALESKDIKGFKFRWFTEGIG